MTTKLLFVCLGNICRSPTAEGIMRHLVTEDGRDRDISCDSAGTGAYHVGSAPDSRMTRAAAGYGYRLAGSARQIVASDLAEFDVILAMDKDNYRNIVQLAPELSDKVQLMCSYCSTHNDTEVPDPYYGGEAGFRYVVELLEDACQGLLRSLTESPNQA